MTPSTSATPAATNVNVSQLPRVAAAAPSKTEIAGPDASSVASLPTTLTKSAVGIPLVTPQAPAIAVRASLVPAIPAPVIAVPTKPAIETAAVAKAAPTEPEPQSKPEPEAAAAAVDATAEPGPEPTPDATADAAHALDQQMEALRAANPNVRTVFKVKYVAEGVAYLDGGRGDGLGEGMKLEILSSELPPRAGEIADPADPRVIAELQVSAVADSSAVTDIRTPKRPVQPGDIAYLSAGDAQALVQQQTLSATRKYPAVVTFSEGDPLEEEARAEVPRPPLPSVNRARGRIGMDYTGTSSSGISTSNLGLVISADITRINGTYWNISGYWRGRMQSTATTQQQTIQDLINRTYHLSMTYDNPSSAWVMGFGRLYLPWAPSLETLDGGYFGRRLAKNITAGMFAGSTPDPSSYNYNPNQEIGGAFVNFEGGSYENWKYTSTSGFGMNAIKFAIQRPFVFFENGIFYKRYFSIYNSLQADSPKGNPAVPAPGPGLSRNFLTVRIQPHPRVEFSLNHSYFRDIPTFDPALIGTGLLDKYLFQGFSVGARVEVVKQVFVYSELGRSSRTGDAKTSLNQSYGVTLNRVPWIGVRADAHYSRFNSSFGSGSYEALTLSRSLSDTLRMEVLLGQQNFTSALTSIGRSRFLNSNLESSFGAHYFIQGGVGVNRGETNYNQWHLMLGYRFDSKTNHK